MIKHTHEHNGPAVAKYSMHEILLRDYPADIGNTIQRILKSDYTLTGHYVGDNLIWALRMYGKSERTRELLSIAVSEYAVDGRITLVDADPGNPYYTKLYRDDA